MSGSLLKLGGDIRNNPPCPGTCSANARQYTEQTDYFHRRIVVRVQRVALIYFCEFGSCPFNQSCIVSTSDEAMVACILSILPINSAHSGVPVDLWLCKWGSCCHAFSVALKANNSRIANRYVFLFTAYSLFLNFSFAFCQRELVALASLPQHSGCCGRLELSHPPPRAWIS